MAPGRQRWEALTPDLVLRVTWTAAGSKPRTDFSLRGYVRRGIISAVVSTVLGSQVPLLLPSGNMLMGTHIHWHLSSAR